MSGILYGVGVGPGDPSLLTFKAVEIIRVSDVVAVPKSGDGERVALTIVAEHIQGKQILDCYLPMTRNQEKLEQCHQICADDICAQLDLGKDVAFITLGDPSIYSTYMYIHKRVLGMGYQAQLIPGVPSFCAVAAALNTSLCEGGQPLHIIPASYKGVHEGLDFDGNKVLMKTGRSIEKLKNMLKEKGIDQHAVAVERCGMSEQKIHQSLDSIQPDASYFSVIVVKEED